MIPGGKSLPIVLEVDEDWLVVVVVDVDEVSGGR
jgi:hypothetical protein